MMPMMSSIFQHLFQPHALALVGASQDPQKWGFQILLNILQGGYRGRVFIVHPRGAEILGVRAYRSIDEIPEPVDLALLVVPSSEVLETIGECGRKGIQAAIVITAGFGEVDPQGQETEREMVALAHRFRMRLVGPNCQGVVSPGPFRLYAHMPPLFPPAGGISVVSQSGNLITSLLRIGETQGLGFRWVVSSGNEADLGTLDFLEAFDTDPETRVILSYLEGVKNGQDFFRRVRPIGQRKPLLMLKAGQTEAGARAARSHTGSLSGTDPIFLGLCHQCGIQRLETLEEMVDVSMALATQPLPQGRRVGILTLGGGWGVLGADYCLKAGLILPDLPRRLVKALDQTLPPWWNRINPIDTVAGYRKGDLIKALELLLRSKVFDGVLVFGFGWRTARGKQLQTQAQGPQDPMASAGQAWIDEDWETLEALPGLIQSYGKPVLLASDVLHWIPGYPRIFQEKRLAAYSSLHRAVRAYAGLVERQAFLQGWTSRRWIESCS